MLELFLHELGSCVLYRLKRAPKKKTLQMLFVIGYFFSHLKWFFVFFSATFLHSFAWLRIIKHNTNIVILYRIYFYVAKITKKLLAQAQPKLVERKIYSGRLRWSFLYQLKFKIFLQLLKLVVCVIRLSCQPRVILIVDFLFSLLMSFDV